MRNLLSRSAAIARAMRNSGPQRGPVAVRMRSEIVNGRQAVDAALASAKAALDARDLESANQFMDAAESQIQQAEAAIRRLPATPSN
jgi:hypothetical protein